MITSNVCKTNVQWHPTELNAIHMLYGEPDKHGFFCRAVFFPLQELWNPPVRLNLHQILTKAIVRFTLSGWPARVTAQ